MNLQEYKNIVIQRLNKAILNNHKESVCYGCMGLIEETGEIIAELRKPLFKGNFHEKPLDSESIKSELGDLIWYLILMCQNCNIDVDEFEKYNISQNNIELPTREKMIQIAMNMGQITGQIVEISLNEKNINTEKEELIKKIGLQYNNIIILAGLLDITLEEILVENIRKINFRYNDKGEANR